MSQCKSRGCKLKRNCKSVWQHCQFACHYKRWNLLFPFRFSGGGKVDLLSRLTSVKSDHLCLRGFAKMLSDLACLQMGFGHNSNGLKTILIGPQVHYLNLKKPKAFRCSVTLSDLQLSCLKYSHIPMFACYVPGQAPLGGTSTRIRA